MRVQRAAMLLACSILLVGCAGSSNSASPVPPPTAALSAPSATTDPAPTPSEDQQGATLEGVPAACVGLGEQDCRRVVAHVASLLSADDPTIGYVQVGPFGCAAGQGCPTTLAARPEGDISLEFDGGALSFHVRVTDGTLQAQRQEVFGVVLPPTSLPPAPGGPQPFTLGHCGLFSGIDLGGSWWDPVGVVDYDHGDAINAAEGTFAPLGPDRAIFTSEAGFSVQLVRRLGPKYLPLCD
jgi:hypothetical protein